MLSEGRSAQDKHRWSVLLVAGWLHISHVHLGNSKSTPHWVLEGNGASCCGDTSGSNCTNLRYMSRLEFVILGAEDRIQSLLYATTEPPSLAPPSLSPAHMQEGYTAM